MNSKKFLILVLFISSTWAFSNHNSGNDEIDPENHDELYSSDDSDDDGKLKIFIYRDQEIQTGAKKEIFEKQLHFLCHLICSEEKIKPETLGKKAIFECISCAKNDVRNYAHAIKYEGLDGEYHELVHWPNDHDCAPSAIIQRKTEIYPYSSTNFCK